jgi:hypothetical protein
LRSPARVRIAIYSSSDKPFPVGLFDGFEQGVAPDHSFLFDTMQSELDQVVRFESSAGPSVAVLELDSEQVIQFVEGAVFDAGLAPVGSEFERNDGVGRDRFVHFETRTRRRYVSEYSPFTAQLSGFRLPLNFDKVSAKIPVLLSFSLHDSMYRQIRWMVYSYRSMRRAENGG